MRAPLDDLESLVSTTDETVRERAWADFLRGYSSVILRVARSMGGGHDATMDRYAFVLDALRRDDYKRLRAYAHDGRGAFTTWLAVVARRLCMDEYRHRYGRAQSDGQGAVDERATRRSLTDLVGDELGVDAIETSAATAPDALVEDAERRAIVERTLARLDVTDRLILRLRFEDELSVPEIARLLGFASPFRLYRQLNKILATVRQDLESSGIRDAKR